MKIIILPSAMKDLDSGFEFYENQAENLGHYFQESLFSDIESLRLYAGIHRIVFGCYRLLSKRFPYSVFYEIEGDNVKIKAVLDNRRNPDGIKRRMVGKQGK